MRIHFFIAAMMLGLLSLGTGTCKKQRITVVGEALHDKGGAVVVTETYYYFVDGLDEWQEKYYGRKVRVTGILHEENHEKQSTDSLQVQEIVGIVRTIKRARWVLME